jgi:class 3 adenylate cyclase
MQESRTRELALLGCLVALWVACFALLVREGLHGGPPQTHLLVGPPAARDAYPTVARLRPGYRVTAQGVRPGDQLIRVGDTDLRGAMPWTVYARTYAEATGSSVRVEYERDGHRAVSVEHLVGDGNPWRDAVLAFGFAITAMLVLWRAPGSRMVRSFAAATLVWTLTLLRFQGPVVDQTYAYLAVRAIAGCLWAPLMVRAAFHFPEGAWPRDRRLPLWPWLFAVLGLTWTSKWMGIPFSHEFGTRANPAVGILLIAAVLLIATRNYRWANALGRRQVRWVLLGAYVGTAPVLLGDVAAMIRPDLAEWWHASQAFLIAIPVSIVIGVTRSNLLDIDRLITRTASYTLMLLVFGGGIFAAVPWLADQTSVRAGIDPTLVQIGAGAALMFCVMRLEPMLRPRIERMFFAERQALQTGIGRLVAEVAKAPDAMGLAKLVGERLDALLRPTSCVIYVRGEQVFEPVFSRGTVMTPAFDADSALLAALAERPSAVDLERGPGFGNRPSPADLATLGSLAAAVLFPVTHEQELAGFVALGRKRSGDIYTPTDLALLGLVGASVSASIARFDREALLHEARELQGRLRQYVPASIATRLAEGRNPEAGERIVSVLFADLRGYASRSEGQSSEAIFSTVSRYTEMVTKAVVAHGGTVVEFNGDGMMAVFGAPDPLPDKESLALAAARQIVDEVGAIAWPGGDARSASLEVGVGVATGPAYVGAIRAVDRYIWSAIGNTTNLAARLQLLTRELGAPIVIDAATRRAAGDLARDFIEHEDVVIRGLQARRSVFAASPRAARAGLAQRNGIRALGVLALLAWSLDAAPAAAAPWDHLVAICIEDAVMVPRHIGKIPIPLGCELIDCCPGCPGAQPRVLDWRVQIAGRSLESLELGFEADANPRSLRFDGDAKTTSKGAVVGRKGATLRGLRADDERVPVAFVQLHLDAAAIDALQNEPGDRGSDLDAIEISIDQMLGPVPVNEFRARYVLRRCRQDRIDASCIDDAIALLDNRGNDSAAILLDGNRAGTCSSDEVYGAASSVAVGNVAAAAACRSELAIFSEGDAMEMRAPESSWTDACGDRVDVRLKPPLSMPINIWLADGTFAKRATDAVTNANAIYDANKTGIQFQIAQTKVVPFTARLPLALGCAAAGSLPASVYAAGQLNVYFSDAPSTGESCESDRNRIFIGTLANVATLPHEIGHALSLFGDQTTGGHTNGLAGFAQDNVMWGGGSAQRKTFSLGQAFRFDVDTNSQLNVNLVRSGPTRSCPALPPVPSDACPELKLGAP